MRGRGGRVYFFAAGARRVFFLAVGAPLPGAWPVRRNPMGRGPASRGARLFFCCGCAARFFFFAVGARQVRSLTCCRPPPSIHCRKASRVRGAFFFCCGCASSGGARLFFCCGCAARLFFCCGCASSLTHSLAARRPESTNSKKAHTTKKKHGFPQVW